MEWVRGAAVGRGSFGTVNLARLAPKHGAPGGGDTPAVMAVKSCPVSQSATLVQEKVVLDLLAGCPEIVGCFGDDISVEPDGRRLYNVFLEYVPGGALSELCRRRAMPEGDVRRYAASILRGLRRVHAAGYVHCDVKPQNVLVAGAGRAKIADFGLAKRAGAAPAGAALRGTPLYMAPESVGRGECEPPSDIWSVGCVVAEMAAGQPPWVGGGGGGGDAVALLFRIGAGGEMPEIPAALSEQGRDFLGRCLARDPAERWTAEMLLDHPFLAAVIGEDDQNDCSERHQDSPWASPRSIFEFPTWVKAAASSQTSSIASSSSSTPSSSPQVSHISAPDRLRQLTTGLEEANWDSSSLSTGGGWITVREDCEEQGMSGSEGKNRGWIWTPDTDDNSVQLIPPTTWGSSHGQ